MPYRYIYIGLALIGLAALAFGIALSPEGEPVVLPEPVEAVSPAPGALVPPQTSLQIDLAVGYEARIIVDGWPIEDAQFVAATGVYRWAPSASHPTINEWAPGEHTVVIVYDTYTGLPDTGRFEWTFRVG
jgi:hypothetical protein